MSMRKGRFNRRQKREKDPVESGTVLTEDRMPEEKDVTVPRHDRFPAAVEEESLDADESCLSYDKLSDQRT